MRPPEAKMQKIHKAVFLPQKNSEVSELIAVNSRQVIIFCVTGNKNISVYGIGDKHHKERCDSSVG